MDMPINASGHSFFCRVALLSLLVYIWHLSGHFHNGNDKYLARD